MMGVLNLWRNECIKLTHQTANRVIIIIALVLAVLLPIAVSGITNEEFAYTYESYMEMADLYEEDIVKVDFIASAQACKFFEENELPDWKEERYWYELREAYLMKFLCEAVVDGRIDKETAYSYYSYLFMDDTGVYWDESEIVIQKDFEVESYVYGDIEENAADIDFEYYLNKAEETIEKLENAVPDMTIEDYAHDVAEVREIQLKEFKLHLNDLKMMYENNKATISEVNEQKVNIEALEFEIAIHEALANAEPQDEDWMMNALSNTFAYAKDALVYNCPVDKEMYLADYANFSDETYDEYVEYCEKEQSFAREALIMLQYAFENHIPLSDSVEHSTKEIVHTCLGGLASVIVLVMVILTATTIAGEYSQGTIRLLVIRPRTRTKIILSKFLALLTAGSLLTLVGFALVYFTAIAVNGINDAFVADLMYSSRVIEINAIIYSVMKLFLPIFSGIILIALAFMMAVATRKAMLSIILPVIISMSSVVVQIIAVAGIEEYSILRFTVLPYLNLGNYLVSPLSGFSMSGNILNMMFGGMSEVFLSVGVSLLHGILIVAIHILILFVISFVVFKRQQIKN